MKNEKMKMVEYLDRTLTTEQLIEVMQEVSSWNSAFNYLEAYTDAELEEFLELAFENRIDMLKACFYGNWNFRDEFFRLNGSWNLESLSKEDYYKEIELNRLDIIEEYLDINNNHLTLEELEDNFNKIK